MKAKKNLFSSVINVFYFCLIILFVLQAAVRIGDLYAPYKFTVYEQLAQNGFLGGHCILLGTGQQLVIHSSSFNSGLGIGAQGSGEAMISRTIAIHASLYVKKDIESNAQIIELSPAFHSESEFSDIFGIEKITDSNQLVYARIEYDPSWLEERMRINVNKEILFGARVKRIWLSGPLDIVTDPLRQHPPHAKKNL
jgi:hypothetical protein